MKPNVLVSFVTAVVAAAAIAAPGAAALRADVAIVFARLDESDIATENYEIWVMDGRGRDQIRLTNNDVGDHEPVWSPDGTKIAWVRYESQFNVGAGDIWVMEADGSDPHRLTNHHADIRRPTWSPDGTRIAYTLDYSIFVMDADGSDQHQISPAGAFDYDPDWSPDGSQIAFVHTGGDIFTMWADGSHRQRLTTTARISERRPAWSPDGDRIAFGGYDSQTGWHAYVMDADGTDRSVLVEADSVDPAWFPEGDRLAIYASTRRDYGLYEVRESGHALKPLGRVRNVFDIQPDIVG